MKKAWRNIREIKIVQVQSQPEDAKRLERLISLLSTGVERLLSEEAKDNEAELVDFQADLLVNTHTEKETIQTESE